MKSIDLSKPRVLAYGSDVKENYRLLEVDEGLLNEIVKNGATIKAPDADSEAVLCTGSRTFQVKDVGTSNLLLLIRPEGPPGRGGAGAARAAEGAALTQATQASASPAGAAAAAVSQPGPWDGLQTQLSKNAALSAGSDRVMVESTASGALEIVETAPRLDQLEALLAERPLGSDMDAALSGKASPSGLYTFSDLLDRVQASEAELLAGIKEVKALLLDGHIRSLSDSYTSEVLELLDLTARQFGHSLTRLPLADMVQALEDPDAGDVRPEVTEHVIKMFGAEVSPGEYCLDATAVCVHAALSILPRAPPSAGGHGAPLPLDAFMAQWAAACPADFPPSAAMLQGFALVGPEGAGGADIVRRFSASDLPRDPAARFLELFRARPRWTLEDLDPYLEGLRLIGQTKEGLLLKYTRASQAKPSEPTYYSQRYDF